MSIQNNIKKKQGALHELKNHCMSADVIETKHHIVVIFPQHLQGDVDGIRVCNSAKGIRTAIQRCETAWDNSSIK